MTFIEVHHNEDQPALAKLIQDTYSSIYQEAAPNIYLGRIIVWQGRMFQQVKCMTGTQALEQEHRIFMAWKLPVNRTRIQIGTYHGVVFTTPPQAKGELAARVREGGRCRPEYVVRPFCYSDFDRE
jgi:hypothetical protein